jgi:hypothetical protein
MARSRLCRVCREFHDLEHPWPRACYAHFGVQANAAPNIRPDGMDAIENPVNGLPYDSKSAYYRAVRDAGYEILGSERLTRRLTPRPPVGPDVKRAIEQLRSR